MLFLQLLLGDVSLNRVYVRIYIYILIYEPKLGYGHFCSEKLCSNIAVKISERNSVLELEIGPDEFGVRNIRVLYGITHQLSPL